MYLIKTTEANQNDENFEFFLDGVNYSTICKASELHTLDSGRITFLSLFLDAIFSINKGKVSLISKPPAKKEDCCAQKIEDLFDFFDV